MKYFKQEIGNIKRIKSQLSEESRKEARIKLRLAITSSIIAVGFLIVLARAVSLHCFKDRTLQFVAEKQYQAVIPEGGRRGKIFDRGGRELAVSLPMRSIYADPRLVADKEEAAKILSKLFSIGEKDILAKFSGGKKFVWIKRRASAEEVNSVEGIAGIYTVEEARRIYPNAELASQLLGAVGLDAEPLAGIELSLNKFLSSKKRSATYKRDARGKFYLSPAGYNEQDDVNDVYLTLDKQIQFAAESSLSKAVSSAHAKGGTAIVMDVSTGAILAMASMPSFDPNDYSKYPQDAWRNRGVTDSVEPGSTFKVLIASAALDSEVVNAETIFDCENGAISVGNAVLHDHDPYGKLSVKDIIKVSSNIGALKIARTLGREKLFEYLRRFGIGRKTGVDYPGEVSGIVRNPENLQQVEFDTVAFGQGISVTPIQMATAFSAIANNGKLMRPYIIDRVVNNQGITILKALPSVASEPIRAETARTVTKLLERVVEEGGTGTRAASSEYKMAGKTGTAQKVAEGTHHYAEGKYYASFIGIAPSYAPKIAVFVGIDEPQGAYYGGVVAGPVFKDIAESALKFLDVPSSLSRVVTASQGGVTASPKIAGGARFQRNSDGSFLVTDVRNLTIRDVLNAVGQADVKVSIEGSGTAQSQFPPPGSVIREGEEFNVSFKQ